jgi:hypothetical protein
LSLRRSLRGRFLWFNLTLFIVSMFDFKDLLLPVTKVLNQAIYQGRYRVLSWHNVNRQILAFHGLGRNRANSSQADLGQIGSLAAFCIKTVEKIANC